MTKLLIIRHGQSAANLDGVFVGHTDSPLSDLGRRQAEATADYIARNYHVDAAYASDLTRAFDTGKAAADRLGLPITPDPRLREIFAGDWEQQKFDDLSSGGSPEYALWLSDIGVSGCPGGESVAQLQSRIVAALRDICEKNPGKTIVIGTHATPLRVFMTHCLGKPLEEMKDVPWVSNASVTEVDYAHGKFTLISASYDAHLGDMRTALPKNV